MKPKSPFLVFQNFISPKQCEIMVNQLDFGSPDVDQYNKPLKTIRHHAPSERLIFSKLQPLMGKIFAHFNCQYKGTEPMIFEFLAQQYKDNPISDNSNFIKNKWVKTKNRDFSGVLFLSDYNNSPPLDTDYEVYGGKREYPQHGFGFKPERGTLIIHPAGPHFIHVHTMIKAGDLFQVVIFFTSKNPYIHQPKNFPGTYKNWFTEIS